MEATAVALGTMGFIFGMAALAEVNKLKKILQRLDTPEK